MFLSQLLTSNPTDYHKDFLAHFASLAKNPGDATTAKAIRLLTAIAVFEYFKRPQQAGYTTLVSVFNALPIRIHFPQYHSLFTAHPTGNSLKVSNDYITAFQSWTAVEQSTVVSVVLNDFVAPILRVCAGSTPAVSAAAPVLLSLAQQFLEFCRQKYGDDLYKYNVRNGVALKYSKYDPKNPLASKSPAEQEKVLSEARELLARS